MLNNLKAEFVRKNIVPYKGVMQSIGCTGRTARNKLKGITPLTIPEAVQIYESYFINDNGPSFEELFYEDNKSA